MTYIRVSISVIRRSTLIWARSQMRVECSDSSCDSDFYLLQLGSLWAIWPGRFVISKTEDLSFNILRVTNRSQHFIRSDRVVMRRQGAQYIFCSLRRCHNIPGTSQYNNDVLRILFRDSQFPQNILFGSGQITTYRQRPSHSMTSPQDLKPLIWKSDNYKI